MTAIRAEMRKQDKNYILHKRIYTLIKKALRKKVLDKGGNLQQISKPS